MITNVKSSRLLKNFPFQRPMKFIENSMENVSTDVEV